MGVGRKDLPGYTGGVSNVNRSGVLMLPMEHDFIATTNNSTFEPSTSTSSSYKSVFCPDYKGDYIVANSLGTNIEYSFSCSDDVFSSKMWSSDSSTTFYHGVGVSFKVTAPVDGYYAVYSSPTYSCGGYAPRDNSSYSRKDQKFSWYKGTSGYTSFSRSYYAKGQSIVINARPRIHYKGCGILAIRQHLRISIVMVFLFFRLSLLMLLLQISQTRRKLLSITIMSKTHGTAMCM